MRTIKELLQIMLDNSKYFSYGLCNMVNTLYYFEYISFVEANILKRYINENPPIGFLGKGYYWEYGKLEPRIKWLEEHIKLQE